MSGGFWVIAEHRRGELLETSLEAVSEMKRLADKTGEDVSAVLMGKEVEELAAPLARHGAARVYLIESEIFEPYCSTVYTRQLIELINEYCPRLVVAGATSSTRDYFPRVAAMAGAALITNCSLFTPGDNGRVSLSKPMYGGKVYAEITAPGSEVIMATARPGAFSLSVPDDSKEAEIIRADPISPPDSVPIKVIDRIEADPKTVDVSEAAMILAGGRGAGNRDGFERLEELAGLLGAAVGGSRPAVDNEWIEFDRQIGQSGKTVAPDVYIACGISGDTWHLMGMKDSGFIIAINKDGKAPVFKIADLGVKADLQEIIPEIIKILRQNHDQDVASHG